jgi:hypothetical protein
VRGPFRHLLFCSFKVSYIIDIVIEYKMYADSQNVCIKNFIFNLICPGCAVVRIRLRILLLTGCVLNDTAWPKGRAKSYDILLLKLSLQVMGKNRILGSDGAMFI